MASHIHIYLIDWIEFHQRFGGTNLSEVDKQIETSDGIFYEAFWSENACEGEQLADFWFDCEHTYDALKKQCLETPPPEDFETWSRWKKFSYISPPASELIKVGTPEFDFCKQWLQDFEFAFSRLVSFYFGDSPIYQDSPIDFSPLEIILGTLSPETVRQVAARFPSSDIFEYTNCRAIIQSADNPPWAMAYALDVLPQIVNKTRDEGKGLCVFVI